MTHRQAISAFSAVDQVELKLTKPERTIVLTSRFVTDDAILQRTRETPARDPIALTMDELEELHCGLIDDEDHTEDQKRRRALQRILKKIEEWFEEDDLDDPSELEGFFGDLLQFNIDAEALAPPDAEAIFQVLFADSNRSMGPDAGTYQVTLSKTDRETLLAIENIPSDVHKLIVVDDPGELRFPLSMRQFMVVALTVREELELASDRAGHERLESAARRLSAALFDALQRSGTLAPGAHRGERTGQATAQEFQLKVSLDHSKPPIWRRIRVADCTLDELHEVIQTSMGWMDCHLHAFEWDGMVFGHPDQELECDGYDETQVYLSQLVADGCKKLHYTYDFGDGWQHTIHIERISPRKPSDRLPECVKGTGACPLEDCGGIWGYYDMLAALRDPKHERHEEMVEWAGEEFDPDRFDVAEVNAQFAE